MIRLARAAALALVLVGGCSVETTIDHSPLNSSWAVPPVEDSLITNGSFENGVAGWSIWYGIPGLSSSGQRSAGGCLTIGPDTGAEIQDVTARLQVGHTYQLNGYIRISSTSQVNNTEIGMYGTDSAGNAPLDNAARVTSDSSSYQRVSMTFTYPANLVQTNVYAELHGGTGAIAFFDDLELLETSPSGTTIPPASRIVDTQGNIWMVTSGLIYENDSLAGDSADVILLLFYGDVIYQQSSSSQWFSWNGTDWIETNDPRP